MNYFDTLHYGDKDSLRTLVQEAIAASCGRKINILEIGSATGVSSAIIAKELKVRGAGRLTCVDLWSEVWGKNGEYNDSFDRWLKNMQEEGVS